MRLETVVETKEGPVEIKANLSQEQVKFLLEVGLNLTLARGAMPFASKEEYAVHDLHQGDGTQQ